MKPVAFDPYGRRRKRWRLPRWLVLLVLGIAVGAGGVVWVQERYLPPRLSAGETTQLRTALQHAESDRDRLQRELGEARTQLSTALADKKNLGEELSAGREQADRLKRDVATLVSALPPDPRGGAVEVRAGRFTIEAGGLAYDVVLSRDRGGDKPLAGVVQFTVAGESAAGSEAAVTLKPVAVSVGTHASVRGSLALPNGFKPRQATITVLDRPDGRQLGMRVMYVR